METLSDLKDVYGDPDIMCAIKTFAANKLLEYKRFKDAASLTTALPSVKNISPSTVVATGLIKH